MSRPLAAACALLCLTMAVPAVAPAAGPPSGSWDGLVQVKSKRMKYVYLAPGADFKPYTKIMLDPTEVAFQKNFVRDFNSSSRGVSRRLSDKDVEKAKQQASDGFQSVFAKAFTDGGYTVVNQPGPDVLRVRSAITNLYVNAPDIQTAGRSRSYAPEAGRANVILEVRDSETGAILGRAVDGRVAGDMSGMAMGTIRNSVTNRADFERMFKAWAKASVDGLNTLKAEGAPPAAK
jgi:hypothetical protein